MQIGFRHCGKERTLELPDPNSSQLRCQQCGALIRCVNVSSARDWIESQVARKRQLAERGRLGTRKQSMRQSDSGIDRDGLSAELAACAILCPVAFARWQRTAAKSQGNRGRDLLRTWTGLDRPAEIKHTRYQDGRRGFLIIRPPRNTPGGIRAEYVDNAYYVLMTGAPFEHTALGWIDRKGLLQEGQLNPVPLRGSQRECWGIHWSKLRPLDELTERAGLGGQFGAAKRWLSDILKI